MIAYLGEIMLKKGVGIYSDKSKKEKIDIDPKERTDDVEVKWR